LGGALTIDFGIFSDGIGDEEEEEVAEELDSDADVEVGGGEEEENDDDDNDDEEEEEEEEGEELESDDDGDINSDDDDDTSTGSLISLAQAWVQDFVWDLAVSDVPCSTAYRYNNFSVCGLLAVEAGVWDGADGHVGASRVRLEIHHANKPRKIADFKHFLEVRYLETHASLLELLLVLSATWHDSPGTTGLAGFVALDSDTGRVLRQNVAAYLGAPHGRSLRRSREIVLCLKEMEVGDPGDCGPKVRYHDEAT